MYEATHPNSSDTVHLWINTFDYVGYVLFFNAICTVIHALSIILWSLRTSAEYNRFHSISITDVSSRIEKLKQDWFFRRIYELNYYPFLPTRQIAEFKVIHVLFRNTFGVPIDFNFGDYLGKCFERYSLNIINLSVISWVVMFVLYGINMIRIHTPYPNNSFKCEESNDNNDSSEHRMLMMITTMIWNNLSNNGNNGDDNGNNGDDHNNHEYYNNNNSTSHNNSNHLNNCDLSYVRFFTICSGILEFYVVFVFMIGRVYTLRLLRKAGVDGISNNEDDLVYFLDEEAAREHIHLQKDSIPESSPKTRRMSIKTFSKFIGTFFIFIKFSILIYV